MLRIEKHSVVEDLKAGMAKKRSTKIVTNSLSSLNSEFNTVSVMYWHTPVVQVNFHNPVNYIVLENGGYSTPTTKRRMNQALEILGSEWRVAQYAYEWYITRMDCNWKWDFDNLKGIDRDDMPIKLNGSPLSTDFLVHYVSSEIGLNVPQAFACKIQPDRWCEHLTGSDKQTFKDSVDKLRKGIEDFLHSEEFWEAWDTVLEYGQITDYDGHTFRVKEDNEGAVWLVRVDTPEPILSILSK